MSDKILGYVVGAATIIGAALAIREFAKQQSQARAAEASNNMNPGAALQGDASWSLQSWQYSQFSPPKDVSFDDFRPRKLEVREESDVYDYLAGNG